MQVFGWFRLQSIRSSPSRLRLQARLFGRTLFHRPVDFAVRSRCEELLRVIIGHRAIGTYDCGVELLSIIRLQLESDLQFGWIGCKRIDLACLSQMFHSLGGLSLHRERSPEIVMRRGITRVTLQNAFPFRDCLVDLALRSEIRSNI